MRGLISAINLQAVQIGEGSGDFFCCWFKIICAAPTTEAVQLLRAQRDFEVSESEQRESNGRALHGANLVGDFGRIRFEPLCPAVREGVGE